MNIAPDMVLWGLTRKHRIRGPVDPAWQGGGTHVSLCGVVTGMPTVDLGEMPLCRRCECGGGYPRRTLSAADIARVAVAFYWPQRHFGPNLRRLCREAIREARNA